MIALSILLPLGIGFALLFIKEESATAKFKYRNASIAIATTFVSLIASLVLNARFAANYGNAQLKEVWYAFGSSGVNLSFAVDGLSLPLVIVTTFLFFIAALFSLSVLRHGKVERQSDRTFWGMLLILEATVLAVFTAYNLIVFYVAWELFLVPLCFLIWKYGLEGRKLASLKFFLYTFVSSVFMLVAFAAIVYYTPRIGVDFDFRPNFVSDIAMIHADKQRLIFLFLIVAFLVKMPVLPFHAWLPLTHSQAPVGTLLLSGLILKLGSYGILRFITPSFPGVLAEWGNVFIWLGIFSMFYGAFAAYRQKSFRYVIAYSSLSHMGLLLAALLTRNEYAVMGSIIQNVAHSLTNALLFVVVSMHLARAKTDSLDAIAPPSSFFYWFAFGVAIFSGIAIPGTVGFVGEFLMLFGLSFKSWLLVAFAVFTVVISLAYMLRLFHKMRAREKDLSWRPNLIERVCIVLLLGAILWFGVFPGSLATHARSTARALTAPGPGGVR